MPHDFSWNVIKLNSKFGLHLWIASLTTFVVHCVLLLCVKQIKMVQSPLSSSVIRIGVDARLTRNRLPDFFGMRSRFMEIQNSVCRYSVHCWGWISGHELCWARVHGFAILPLCHWKVCWRSRVFVDNQRAIKISQMILREIVPSILTWTIIWSVFC